MESKDIIIGITEVRLAQLVEEAAKKGYEAARKDMEAGEWLNSRQDICNFLSPERPISTATFNRNRQKGMYGTAIIGNGIRCKARKNELLDAIRQYKLAAL